METSKTRIYRGGLSGLLGQNTRESAPEEPAAPPEPQPRRASVPPPWPPRAKLQRATLDGLAPVPPNAQDSRRISLSQLLPIAPGAQPSSGLHATKIMPIESLFPGQGTTAALSEAELDAARKIMADGATHKLAADDGKKRRRQLPRFLGHVLVGLLTLLAVAAWMMPRFGLTAAKAVRSRALVPTAVAAPPAVLPPEPVEVAAPEPPQPPQPTAAEPVQRPSAPLKPNTARAAIDAVVAGDYTTAERLYQDLARANPNSVVYQEAARIIAARNQPAR